MRVRFLFIAAWLFLPGVVYGQRVPPDTTLETALEHSFSKSYFVRITSPSVVQGRILAKPDTLVHLAGSQVALRDIRQIDYRLKSGGGLEEGALVGGLLGGVAFLFLGHHGGDDGSTVGAIALGTGTGATIGAILGGVLWPAREQWHMLWKR